MKPQIEKIFTNKKSKTSEIYKHISKAYPDAKSFDISTNTMATDENYKLISLSWKDRAKQKKHYAAVLHRNSKWNLDPNGRSTDFLPSNMMQSGCGYLCAYCYIDRHEPTYIKLYDDCYKFIDFCKSIQADIPAAREKFKSVCGKDFEMYRDPKHSKYVTVDIGCDDQITISNRITKHDSYPGHIVDIVNQVNESCPDIMLSFASKDHDFSDYAPFIKNPKMNRIRLSLMPENHRANLEATTSHIIDIINSINDLVKLGFEVHINLSPIVVTDNFASEYAELLSLINEKLSDEAKNQMAYEIIFITHDNVVNNNMSTYMPKAYDMIANGPIQLVPKWNKPNVYSYDRKNKDMLKQIVYGLIDEFTPYARVRYMF